MVLASDSAAIIGRQIDTVCSKEQPPSLYSTSRERDSAKASRAAFFNPVEYLFCNMVFQRGGCVYITTNKQHSVLYTGVTSEMLERAWKHKNKHYPNSFSAKYNCDKLVYYCFYSTIEEAIAAEKSIKAGSRQKKIKLINAMNPDWNDLYEDLLNE
jgi:putative endonuclease